MNGIRFPRDGTEYYRIEIAGLTRDLPIVEVAPGVRVALFNPLGDHEMNEAAGREMARDLANRDPNLQALVMPDGKAQALLHVIGRELGLPTFVARKEAKPYMRDLISAEVKSITTQKVQTLYLDGHAGTFLRGKRIAVIDDVVSSGGTLRAMQALLEKVGATHVTTAAVFVEGNPPSGIMALGYLPLF